MTILATHDIQLASKEPVVAFEFERERFTRYLTIHGDRVFEIGFWSDTVEFYFKKLIKSNISYEGRSELSLLGPPEIRERLRSSSHLMDPTLLRAIGRILPAGSYRVIHRRIKPSLVMIGDESDYFFNECASLFWHDEFGPPNNTETPYYRCMTRTILDGAAVFFDFVIPCQWPGTLDAEEITAYESMLNAQVRPTALALSVLDAKARPPVMLFNPTGEEHLVQVSPWRKPPYSASWGYSPAPSMPYGHLCLANYLLDGHHKVHAAARIGAECGLLCFLALNHSHCPDWVVPLAEQTLGRPEAGGGAF